MKNMKETTFRILFTLAACMSIGLVALICLFLFVNGVPAMAKVGLFDFLLGQQWKPGQDIYGIMPMILGSIYVTAGALVIGVPIGILTAVFMARFCSPKIYRVLKPAVELLAGIPSVVYGFFGLMVVVPFVRSTFGGTGMTMLSACIILGIMILPSIIGVAEPALRAVPESYYEGALALGATHERSVFCAVLPAAKSGVLAGIVLGIGRAIGETMAVIMIAGNQKTIPKSLIKGVRTLTSNIAIDMAYAADLHREALIATAVVLFVFILIINALFSVLNNKTT